MEHCRWWSQCKSFHEYKFFEPGWPSLDCDCAGVCMCVCMRSLLCMCVSVQWQQLHSISLLLQHSWRSSGSNTHTNQTQRCVGGHFEPTVGRAWAASEKMNRRYFRGDPCNTRGPTGGSRRLALLCRSYCTKTAKVNRLPQRLKGGVGARLRHMGDEVSHITLIPIFL